MIDQLYRLKPILDNTLSEWWIDCGTLLGVYRDGDLIPWDSDIDIGTWFKEGLDFPMEGLSNEYDHRIIYMNGTPLKLRLLPKEGGKPVDIAFYQVENDEAVKRSSFKKPRPSTRFTPHWFWQMQIRIIFQMLRGKVDRAQLKHNWPFSSIHQQCTFRVPHRFFSDLTEVRGLPAPSPVEEYLEHHYGTSWRTPNSEWVWHRDDKSIKTSDYDGQ